MPGTLGHDSVFEFPGGPALAGFGVAEAALDCLGAVVGPVRFETVSRLLRSPYAGDPGERDARISFEVALRERGLLEWPQVALVARARAAGCTGFANALESAGQALRRDPGPRGADVWAQAYGGALTAWGWPGRATLASDEYQAALALRERLRDFAALARTAPRMRAAEALREFSRVVAGAFQPERGEAAIWLYDLLEPPGVGFDGLLLPQRTQRSQRNDKTSGVSPSSVSSVISVAQ